MKKESRLRDIYRGIRKPVAPPTRVDKDKREKLKRKEARKEIDRHVGRRSDDDKRRED